MVGNGAARMFAGRPQPVEIHHRGIWYSGELIGWRHESNGRVAARVRCRVDGLRHSAWMDLADLRLPDPKRPPHKEPFPVAVRPAADPRKDEDDATRPHALLPGMHTRPAKPGHAVQPPAAAHPAAEPVDASVPRPAVRPNQRLRKHEAYLSVV
ncbi:hypothetical protein [Blastococcus mobilis]|uniref:Uncharacterized protein n=1 Tax=Blastococcus mobilis TaxID=1938746 RepID=A0A239A4B7_9ACTN|nr:hypothetical protein [Blastococcus mobilis]SNR90339.1 hypothetical protein SAMN06272737_13729 [Blastococcus mobilis]